VIAVYHNLGATAALPPNRKTMAMAGPAAYSLTGALLLMLGA